MSDPVVREMRPSDIIGVVGVHLASFPGFFLSFLGPRFLAELYRGILADPAGIAFVAEDGGRCLGFVAGTATPARFYRRLLQRRLLRFALASAVPLLRRPSIFPRLLRAFSKPAEAPAPEKKRAELMSLAVAPGVQQHGLGALLTEAFCAEAARRNAPVVFLTTDAEGNESVNRFYSRRGFAVVREFTTPEGRRMKEYERAAVPEE